MARQKGAPDAGVVERIRAFQRSAKANKRCADCTERGPTYICTDYQTFVCQICSGIHREFGHKIKGISLSDWSEKEVECIEQGGNEKAAHKWLAKFESEKISEPDNTQADLVRDFIRKKYVEKRWLGQGSHEVRSVDNGARLQSRRSCPAVVTGLELHGAENAVASDANSWTADFSNATVAPATSSPSDAVPAAPSAGDAQWVADFGFPAAASPFQIAPTIAPSQPGTPVPATIPNHGINPCLLGLDFSGDAEKAHREKVEAAAINNTGETALADKLALVLEAQSRYRLDASKEAAEPRALGTPGEQLRDALLNGSGDAMRRLYEDSWRQTGGVPQGIPQLPQPVHPRRNTHFYIGDECPITTAVADVNMSPQNPRVRAATVGEVSPLRASPQHSSQLTAATQATCVNMDMFDDDDINDCPPREFDDLIHAFQEKNPVLGFDL